MNKFAITFDGIDHFYRVIHYLNRNIGRDNWTMNRGGGLKQLNSGLKSKRIIRFVDTSAKHKMACELLR